jgi:hypothetical protein
VGASCALHNVRDCPAADKSKQPAQITEHEATVPIAELLIGVQLTHEHHQPATLRTVRIFIVLYPVRDTPDLDKGVSFLFRVW